jgi:hypothetical protein
MQLQKEKHNKSTEGEAQQLMVVKPINNGFGDKFWKLNLVKMYQSQPKTNKFGVTNSSETFVELKTTNLSCWRH